jgi:hypothetical protein
VPPEDCRMTVRNVSDPSSCRSVPSTASPTRRTARCISEAYKPELHSSSGARLRTLLASSCKRETAIDWASASAVATPAYVRKSDALALKDENHRTTWFIHEQCTGVKCICKRGCIASHARTSLPMPGACVGGGGPSRARCACRRWRGSAPLRLVTGTPSGWAERVGTIRCAPAPRASRATAIGALRQAACTPASQMRRHVGGGAPLGQPLLQLGARGAGGKAFRVPAASQVQKVT